MRVREDAPQTGVVFKQREPRRRATSWTTTGASVPHQRPPCNESDALWACFCFRSPECRSEERPQHFAIGLFFAPRGERVMNGPAGSHSSGQYFFFYLCAAPVPVPYICVEFIYGGSFMRHHRQNTTS